MATSKENQTIMAQQGVIISSLIKGMDKAAARAALTDVLHGAKAISSKREFMAVAPRYTFCELTTHLPPHHSIPRQGTSSGQKDGRTFRQAGD
jgi:hypothetical protein